MKIIVWIMLAALLVFSFAVPAFAQDADHTCTHGDATISDLRDCLDQAVMMGHVDNPGVARSLFAKLDAAQTALNQGNVNAAVRTLNAFIDEIEAHSGTHIDAEFAAHIIAHAQAVIDALS